MNKLIQFDDNDRKLWLGILGVSAVGIIILSVFSAASFLSFLARAAITIFILFLPGYSIYKLFFNNLKLSDYPIIDRFLASLFFSIATVQTLYFLTTYLRTYGFNVDEDVISSDSIAVSLAVLVTAAAVGIKYYLNKKNESKASA